MSILPYVEAAQCLVGQAVTDGGGAPAEGTPPAPMSGLGSMLPMLILFAAIFYFFMLRPQQKRDRERREMLAAVAKGDAVITTGGICGTVVNLSETHVILRVDDDVTIEFVRSSVAQIVKKKKEDE